MSTNMNTKPNTEASLGTMTMLAFTSVAGLALEFYAFVLFGYASATAFPKIFFPNLPTNIGVAVSFLAFAAGFPARVIGSFIFGHFGDRLGRRVAFSIDLVLVGIGTVFIGVLPGTAQIGVAAPILLVLLRAVQGIGLGGEFGGATALLAEYASNRKYRGFWTGWANGGFSIGGLLGAAMLLIFASDFSTVGWRYAFLLSAVVVVPAIIARLKLAESPYLSKVIREKQASRYPSIGVFRKYWKPIFLLALFSAFQQFDGYTSLTYMVSFMKFAGYTIALVAIVTIVGRVYDFFGVAFNGIMAGIARRKTVAYASVIITVAMAYPYVLAILSKNFLYIFAVLFVMVFFGVGMMHAMAPVLTSEHFPTKYRYSGGGISYQISAVFGGMMTPTILTLLIGKDVATKGFYIPLFYLIYGIIAIVAIYLVKETKNTKLEELDAATT